MNITTILGLGIDYGLFMVTRFREELHRQPSVEQAVARTVATAGRTVAVSGVTIAVALTSLMLFPETFLRSMSYGGVATVAVDMLAALTALRIRRSLPFSITGHRAPVRRPAEAGAYTPSRASTAAMSPTKFGVSPAEHDRRALM